MDDFDDDDGDGYWPPVISRRRVDFSDSDDDGPRIGGRLADPFLSPGLLGEAPPPDILGGGGGLFANEPAEISRGSRPPLNSAPSEFASGPAVGASSSSSSSAKNARFSDSLPVEVGRPDGRSNSPSVEERNRPLNVRRLSTPQQRVEDKGRYRIDELAIEEEDEDQGGENGFGQARPDDYDFAAESQLFSEIPDDCLMGEASVPTLSPSERISFSRVSFNRESFAERASFDRVSLKRISHQKIIDPHSAHWAEYEDRNSFGDTTTDQVLGSIFEIEGDTAGAFFDSDIPVEALHQPGDAPDSFAAIVAAAAASARPLWQANNGLSSSSSALRSGGDVLGFSTTSTQKAAITPNFEAPAGRRSREGAAVSLDLDMLCELDPMLEETREEEPDVTTPMLPPALAPAFEPPSRQVSTPVAASPSGVPVSAELPSSSAASAGSRRPSFDAGGLLPLAEDPAAEEQSALPTHAARKNVSLSAKMRASGIGGAGVGVQSGGLAPAEDPADPFGLGARSVWNSSPAGDLGLGLGASSASRTGGFSAFGVAAPERRTTGLLPVRRMVEEDVAPPILVPSSSEHSLRAHPRTTAASCAQQYSGGALGFAEAPPQRREAPEDAAEPPPPPRTPDGRPTAPAVPPLDSMLQSRGSTTALDVVRMAQRRVTF